MRSLFVVALFAMSAAHLSRQQLDAHFVTLDAHFTTLSKQAPHPDPIVNQNFLQCVTAYTTFNQTATGTCRGLFDAFAKDADQATATQAVNDHCPTCGTLIANQIEDVWRYCDPLNRWQPGERDGVRVFILVTRLVCVKYDGDGAYCLPKAKALDNLDQGDLTEAKLVNVCHPCNAIWLALYGAFSEEPTARLGVALVSLACTKWEDKWCALETRAAMDLPAPNQGEETTQFLDAICAPCVRLFLRRTNWLATRLGTPNANITAYVDNVHHLCAKKANGDYCLPQIAAAEGRFQDIGGNCSADFNAGTCGQACKSTLTSLSTDLGCCMGTALSIFTRDNAGPTELQIRAVVGITCGIALPISCAAQAVVVTVILRNLAWAYVQSHLDDIKTKIAADLCYLTGSNDNFCSKDSVTVTENTVGGSSRRLLAASSTSFAYSINDPAMTTGDMTIASNAVTGAAQGGSLFLPSVEGLPEAAKLDSLGGFTSTPNPSTVSDAAVVSAGFAALVAFVALVAL